MTTHTRPIQKPSLSDVAREAGVSATLVSRILRGKRGNIRFSKETETRVREVAKQLGYVPRRDARNLVTRRSHTLALLSPQPAPHVQGRDAWGNHFLHQILSGIEAACAERDYNCLFSYWAISGSDRSHPRIMLDQSVDGVVLTDFTAPSVVEYLLEAGVKCAQVGSNVDPECEIDRYYGDLEAAISEVVLRYYDQGHRRVAIFRPDGFGALGVAQAFEAAAAPLKDFHAQVVPCGRITADSVRRLVLDLLRQPSPGPTALICPSGTFALALATEMAARGVRCPDDYAMIAWVSAGWPETFLPDTGAALSTIDLPNYEAARRAAADLILQLEAPGAFRGPQSRNHTWPCEINWRDSTERSLPDRA